jgi:hypothetical protein
MFTLLFKYSSKDLFEMLTRFFDNWDGSACKKSVSDFEKQNQSVKFIRRIFIYSPFYIFCRNPLDFLLGPCYTFSSQQKIWLF